MWIKICGIRDTETAEHIAKLGASAIGLNFYSLSPRSIGLLEARRVADAVRDSMTPVGLFVNHTLEEVRRTCEECQLTTIQLHGGESPEFLAELPEFQIIKAFRVGSDGLAPVFTYLQRCTDLGIKVWACLIDAAVPGQFGGSGAVVDWARLAHEYPVDQLPPLILAGGLTAENVAQAIQVVQPWGVDVASGVESLRGVKDKYLVEKFIHASQRV